MEKFMFVFRNNVEEMAKLSPEGIQKNMEKWMTWMGKLTQEGHYTLGNGNQLTGMNGKVVSKAKHITTDGPFIEGKEVISGLIDLNNVKDMEEAVKLAKGCPGLELGGSVEIRTCVVRPDM